MEPYTYFYHLIANTSQSQGTEPITGYKGMLVQSKSEKDLPGGEKVNDE